MHHHRVSVPRRVLLLAAGAAAFGLAAAGWAVTVNGLDTGDVRTLGALVAILAAITLAAVLVSYILSARIGAVIEDNTAWCREAETRGFEAGRDIGYARGLAEGRKAPPLRVVVPMSRSRAEMAAGE